MNIGEVVKGIFSFLYEDATQVFIKPFFEILQTVALSPESLAKMDFITNMIDITRAIGAAILLLVVSWQVLKSMLPMFFEADDPLRIGVRTFIAGFLLFTIDDLLLYFVSICSGFIDLVADNQSWDGVGMFELYQTITGMGGLNLILMLVLLIKCIGFFYRMFQRLAMCALLILCSPIAVATMVSKATQGFWDGFVKLFVGNILIQILQVLCYTATFACFFSIGGAPGADSVFYIMLTIAVLGLANKLEDIVNTLSINVGIGRDMQGALSKLQGAAYTTMTVQSVVSKF